MQCEIFQAFICYDFDDYGLQLMKNYMVKRFIIVGSKCHTLIS